MANITFNTTSGQTIQRELLIAYLNTGTSNSPTWSPLGSRVSDSSEEIDWNTETSTDILGVVRTEMKKPVITQSFDPFPLDAGDAAGVWIWNLAVKEQDYAALAAQDVLIVHCYAGTADSAMFAERYPASAIEVTGLGGEGGGTISQPINVSYGGARKTGTAAISSAGVVTFTADT